MTIVVMAAAYAVLCANNFIAALRSAAREIGSAIRDN